MPSHPDRVRRNYHKIEIAETEDLQTREVVYLTRITRLEIATQMSRYEVQQYVYNKFLKSLGPSK